MALFRAQIVSSTATSPVQPGLVAMLVAQQGTDFGNGIDLTGTTAGFTYTLTGLVNGVWTFLTTVNPGDTPGQVTWDPKNVPTVILILAKDGADFFRGAQGSSFEFLPNASLSFGPGPGNTGSTITITAQS